MEKRGWKTELSELSRSFVALEAWLALLIVSPQALLAFIPRGITHSTLYLYLCVGQLLINKTALARAVAFFCS